MVFRASVACADGLVFFFVSMVSFTHYVLKCSYVMKVSLRNVRLSQSTLLSRFESPYVVRMICITVWCFEYTTRNVWYRDSGYTFVYDYINAFCNKGCFRVWVHKIQSQIHPLNRDNNNRHENDQRG